MNKKRILILACVLLGAAVGGVIWYSRSARSEPSSTRNPSKQPKSLMVEVAPVRLGQIVHRLDLSGEVVAGDSVVIAATKEGPIAYCPWREGDTVKTGDKLVEIDREVHRAEVQAAEAALAVARAKLADLKADARPEEVQKAEANVRRWQATLAEAQRSHERQEQL